MILKILGWIILLLCSILFINQIINFLFTVENAFKLKITYITGLVLWFIGDFIKKD